MPVKLGVSCGGDLWSREDILAVEELGFDSYWTGEHIVYHRPIMEAVTLLSYVAGLTTRIKMGPATLLLPLRHPTMIAKQLSCLDVLSEGRLLLTVGVGGDYPREFEGCNVPIKERGRRTTEALEIELGELGVEELELDAFANVRSQRLRIELCHVGLGRPIVLGLRGPGNLQKAQGFLAQAVEQQARADIGVIGLFLHQRARGDQK